MAPDEEQKSDQRTRNRLGREKSPYLIQHADNPVDWHPFGDEAIERARREDKPIFLSIGYSTCHWCHVMAQESFEDPDTAALMNEHFVNVKVDREERPDVDHIYMQAVVAMTGRGGWPLSVWLTPDLEPFYGGTYFPPERRWQHPSFREVLSGLARVWRERRDQVHESSRQLMDVLRRAASAHGDAGLPDDLPRRVERDLSRAFDPGFGGFGPAPKFPRPAALAFLAHQAARTDASGPAEMLERTLEMMWRGGIYDHVGGGFARYSTDERWLVPHFEKMLYDNALLVESYLDGRLLCGREDFARVVRDVLAFVEREMTHPDGGFFSAQDADSEGGEGRFYVFTPQELAGALGDDLAAFAGRVFGVTEEGSFEGRNILHWPRPLEETARDEGLSVPDLLAKYEEVRRLLYDFRERRERPGLDDKILTSWNGLMIGACARAGAVLGEPRYVRMAERAALFAEERLRADDGMLLRRWRDGEARYAASLDDHACLAFGLLALFSASGRTRWLARAAELFEEIEARYGDPDGGGFWFAAEGPDLVVRMKDAYDGAMPSGNGMAALLAARLGAVLGREDLRRRALDTARSFADALERMPEAHPLLVCAAVEAQEPPRTLFVVGDPDSGSFAADLERASSDLMPGRVVIPVPDAERSDLAALGVPVHDKDAGAWLCEEAACRPF